MKHVVIALSHIENYEACINSISHLFLQILEVVAYTPLFPILVQKSMCYLLLLQGIEELLLYSSLLLVQISLLDLSHKFLRIFFFN